MLITRCTYTSSVVRSHYLSGCHGILVPKHVQEMQQQYVTLLNDLTRVETFRNDYLTTVVSARSHQALSVNRARDVLPTNDPARYHFGSSVY